VERNSISGDVLVERRSINIDTMMEWSATEGQHDVNQLHYCWRKAKRHCKVPAIILNYKQPLGYETWCKVATCGNGSWGLNEISDELCVGTRKFWVNLASKWLLSFRLAGRTLQIQVKIWQYFTIEKNTEQNRLQWKGTWHRSQNSFQCLMFLSSVQSIGRPIV
jgi:hypothetical protein